MAPIELEVLAAGGRQCSFEFDGHRPLADQVRAVCAELGALWTSEEDFWVLTHGETPDSQPIYSEASLRTLHAHSRVGLYPAADVVLARVRALDECPAAEVTFRLQDLLATMRMDAWLLEEVVLQEGIHVVIKAAMIAGSGSDSTFELAMTCLCELLSSAVAVSWLSEHQDEITPSLFARLFSVVFPGDPESKGEDGNPRKAQMWRASFYISIFLLRTFPGSAAKAAHIAASGDEGFDDEDADDSNGSGYERMVGAMTSENQEDPLAVAANCLLGTMAGAATGQDELMHKLQTEIISYTDGITDSDSIFNGQRREESCFMQLLMSSMSATVDLSVDNGLHSSEGKSVGKTVAFGEIHHLREQLQHTHASLERVQMELRQRHRAVKSMVKFVKVDSSLLVEQSLDSIIRLGWDSIQWSSNYSLLHFVSECVDDPNVVELVGTLATDLEQLDDYGKRPVDYARTNPNRDVPRMLEKMRRVRRQQAKEVSGREHVGRRRPALSSHAAWEAAEEPADPALRKKFDALQDLEPSLKTALDEVLAHGWNAISWPSGFSGLHLAAESGHVGAVELLIEAKGDASAMDDWHLTPMDYAAQGGYNDVIDVLQRHFASQAMGNLNKPYHKTKEALAAQMTPRQNQLESVAEAAQDPEPEPATSTSLTVPPPSASRTRSKSRDRPRDHKQEQPPPEKARELSVPPGLNPLLKHACDMVMQNGWGMISWPSNFTALHLAARLGSVEAVQFLMDAGAEPALELKDHEGKLPMDHAREKDRKNVIEFFTNMAGGKSSASKKKSAVESAASERHPPGVQPEAEPSRSARSDSRGKLPLPATPPMHIKVTDTATASARGPAQTRMSCVSADVEGERAVSKRRNTMLRPDMGVEELRAEVTRLQTERDTLRASHVRTMQTSSSSPLAGPLEEEHLATYLIQLNSFGRDAVLEKLREPPLSGGQALSWAESELAMVQLEAVGRIADAIGPVTQRRQSMARPTLNGAPTPRRSGVQRATLIAGISPTPGKGALLAPPSPGKGQPPAGKGPGAKGSGPPAPDKGKGKGKGKAANEPLAEPSKPLISPKVAMKPLWWVRYQMDIHIQPGQTVWDGVQEKTGLFAPEDLEKRFCKNASSAAVEAKPGKQSDVKKPKFLRIVTDPQRVAGLEAALKKLPPAKDVARAIIELDESELPPEILQRVIESACPTPEQFKQLQDAKEQDPTLPMALPETYMWVIGNIPGYRARLDCWHFVCTYHDRLSHYQSGVKKFSEITKCVRQSKALPLFLSLILAVGNFLNGGTERGRADGFDFSTLSLLDAVKDPSGKDLRHFILDIFFQQQTKDATTFIDEFRPLLSNVARTLGRDSEGSEKLNKRAHVTLEGFDQCVDVLQDEFTTAYETMQMMLQYNDDPADQLRLCLPDRFVHAKRDIDALVEQRDRVKDEYLALLKWLKVTACKSGDFCLVFDNILIPETLITSRPDKVKKEALIPYFCRNNAISLDHLLVLWEFRDPEQQRAKLAKQRRKEVELAKQKLAAVKRNKQLWARAGGFAKALGALKAVGGAGGSAAAPEASEDRECPKCSNLMMNDAKFCRKCGAEYVEPAEDESEDD